MHSTDEKKNDPDSPPCSCGAGLSRPRHAQCTRRDSALTSHVARVVAIGLLVRDVPFGGAALFFVCAALNKRPSLCGVSWWPAGFAQGGAQCRFGVVTGRVAVISHRFTWRSSAGRYGRSLTAPAPCDHSPSRASLSWPLVHRRATVRRRGAAATHHPHRAACSPPRGRSPAGRHGRSLAARSLAARSLAAARPLWKPLVAAS